MGLYWIVKSSSLFAPDYSLLANYPEAKQFERALADFPVGLNEYQRYRRIVDARDYTNQTVELELNLGLSIADIYVACRIGQRRMPRRESFIARLLINGASAEVSPKFVVNAGRARLGDISHILASLHELIGRARSVSEIEHQNPLVSDSNIPVDAIYVADQINQAIVIIEREHPNMNRDVERLIAYLEEAKRELVKPRPSYKKILGALVISATIASGVAVLPDVTQMINNAMIHIMGYID